MENILIAEDLKPTLENVSREFIIGTLTEIMYGKYYPNFNVIFSEKEAINFIKKTINDNININLNKNCMKLVKYLECNEEEKYDSLKSCLIINNYKLFFNNLVELYKRVIDYYFKDENNRKFGFPIYEMRNYFAYIWIRMLPEDFNNPELFLEKQIKMMSDESLSKYDKEVIIGNVESLGNNVLSIKNNTSDNWNENSNEFRFRIYDYKSFREDKYFNYYYQLPLVRYGIYEKNGVKTCVIGSIQNKSTFNYESSFDKQIERKKYKLNKNIDQEYMENVEPKNLLALSIFIDVLIKENIYDIEIPCLYVLDNEYHKRRSEELASRFKEKYNGDSTKPYYEEDKKVLEQVYEKADLISALKSNNYIKLFERLMYQYNSFEIISYPFEGDSNLHIRLNKVNGINNEMLNELYYLIENTEVEKKYKVC